MLEQNLQAHKLEKVHYSGLLHYKKKETTFTNVKNNKKRKQKQTELDLPPPALSLYTLYRHKLQERNLH